MKAQLFQNLSQGSSSFGRVANIVAGIVLVYMGASLAIETGSLWFYAGTIAVLIMTVRHFVIALHSK